MSARTAPIEKAEPSEAHSDWSLLSAAGALRSLYRLWEKFWTGFPIANFNKASSQWFYEAPF